MKKTFDPQIETITSIKDKSLIAYFRSIPSILLYQAITKVFLYILAYVLKACISYLVGFLGAGAITNSDFPILFKSVPGLLILTLGMIVLILYTIFDLNCMILIADNFLHDKKENVFNLIWKAIESAKYLLHPTGIFVILFVSIIAPLTVSLYGISLTESFYIPDFIMSVIQDTILYRYLYYGCFVLFGLFGFFYLYSFHIMILRKENIFKAMHTSRLMMKTNWKNFLIRYGLFIIKSTLVLGGVFVLLVVIPPTIYYFIAYDHYNRLIVTFLGFSAMFTTRFLTALFIPFQFMELNRIYESYTIEDEGELVPPSKRFNIRFILIALASYGCIFGLSYFASIDEIFDIIFPNYTVSDVVAHRAGGNLAHENTMLGLKAAVNQGVRSSEIDVQRTKDNEYVIYHDNTLDRLCGVNKAVNELTLKQCKELEVRDTFRLGQPKTELATLEEMLDYSKGKIHLFIELKGTTADSKMAEDVYSMIVERDMIDETTIISLKYDLIDELESKHPETNTGYLCYVSLGNVAKLNCDVLLLEDEMATDKTIEEAHKWNKSVYIWTVDSDFTLKRRMLDDSDGIITDDISLAKAIRNLISDRSDFTRVLDYVLTYL